MVREINFFISVWVGQVFRTPSTGCGSAPGVDSTEDDAAGTKVGGVRGQSTVCGDQPD